MMDREQVEFSDYVQVLINRKWLIVTGLVAGALLAVLADARRPPQFLVGATLETVGLDDESVEKTITGLAGSHYQNGPVREPLEIDAATPGTLNLRFRTRHPRDASESLTEIVAKLTQALERSARAQTRRHKSRHDALGARIAALEHERSFLQTRIVSLQDTLAKLRALRNDARGWTRDSSGMLAMLHVSDEIDRSEHELNSAQRRIDVTLPVELADLQVQLEDFDSVPPPEPKVRIAAPPNPSGTRVGGPWRALPVGLVIGFWATLLLAFVLEYARRPSRSGSVAHEPVS